MPNEPVAGLIVHKNYLNVGQTPAQRRRDDQNYGDHTEISGLLSNQQMLQHFSDLEIASDNNFGLFTRTNVRRLSRIDHFA
jgi:hypothetical protein